MKFPTLIGTIIMVKADPKEARLCYTQSLKVNPYSLKTIGKHTTQTGELQAPLAECNNMELAVKQEPEEMTTNNEAVVEGEDEVVLDPRKKFRKAAPCLTSQ